MYSVLSGLTMTQLYSYDTMNRLTSAQENKNNWVQNHAYDGVGNRWVALMTKLCAIFIHADFGGSIRRR